MILETLGLLFLGCIALAVLLLAGIAGFGSNRSERLKTPDHPVAVRLKRCLWLTLDVIFHCGIVMCVLLISGLSWASDVWKTLEERRNAKHH